MNKRVPVARVAPGQSATFALKRLKKGQLRKGMILAGAALQVRVLAAPPPPRRACANHTRGRSVYVYVERGGIVGGGRRHDCIMWLVRALQCRRECATTLSLMRTRRA